MFNADDAIAAAIAGKVAARAYYFSTRGRCPRRVRRRSGHLLDDGDGAKRVCGLDWRQAGRRAQSRRLSRCGRGMQTVWDGRRGDRTRLVDFSRSQISARTSLRLSRDVDLQRFQVDQHRLYDKCVRGDERNDLPDSRRLRQAAVPITTSFRGCRRGSGTSYAAATTVRASSNVRPRTTRGSCTAPATLERAVMLGLSFGADNLLFSPSTSSYDAYRNFEERGRHFEQTVRDVLRLERKEPRVRVRAARRDRRRIVPLRSADAVFGERLRGADSIRDEFFYLKNSRSLWSRRSCACCFFSRVEPRLLAKLSPVFLVVSIGLLAALFIPGLGVEMYARRVGSISV